MITDIKKSGSRIKIKIGDARATSYPAQDVRRFKILDDVLQIEVVTTQDDDLFIPIADLTVDGLSPLNAVPAEEMLDAVFPNEGSASVPTLEEVAETGRQSVIGLTYSDGNYAGTFMSFGRGSLIIGIPAATVPKMETGALVKIYDGIEDPPTLLGTGVILTTSGSPSTVSIAIDGTPGDLSSLTFFSTTIPVHGETLLSKVMVDANIVDRSIPDIAALVSTIDAAALVPGKKYFVQDIGDTGAVLEAAFNKNSVAMSGIAGFLNADYNSINISGGEVRQLGIYTGIEGVTGYPFTSSRGKWRADHESDGDPYISGDLVAYKNINYQVTEPGNFDSTPPDVNPGAYVALGRGLTLGYIEEVDDIKFHSGLGAITERRDRRGNFWGRSVVAITDPPYFYFSDNGWSMSGMSWGDDTVLNTDLSYGKPKVYKAYLRQITGGDPSPWGPGIIIDDFKDMVFKRLSGISGVYFQAESGGIKERTTVIFTMLDSTESIQAGKLKGSPSGDGYFQYITCDSRASLDGSVLMIEINTYP